VCKRRHVFLAIAIKSKGSIFNFAPMNLFTKSAAGTLEINCLTGVQLILLQAFDALGIFKF
jgi:hypothetical protein